jgi:hypothetical protein
MSKENPYRKYLDGRQLETILSATPDALAECLEAIGTANVNTPPAPGKWSATEIVSHLADCEMVFGFRLRQTLADDSPTLQPFDQDKWAWTATYSAIPTALALEVFTALRKWNLRLIQKSLPEAAGRTATHPERGALTFGTLVETVAGHDLNHLGQLRALAGK